jgi:small subunit ribosomal protein S17
MSENIASKPKGAEAAPNVAMKRRVQGRVVSNKMNKTLTVLIERRVKHPLYGKYVNKSTKVHAHDENNLAQEGDLVILEEHRPFSKTKSWNLVEIAEKVKV